MNQKSSMDESDGFICQNLAQTREAFQDPFPNVSPIPQMSRKTLHDPSQSARNTSSSQSSANASRWKRNVGASGSPDDGDPGNGGGHDDNNIADGNDECWEQTPIIDDRQWWYKFVPNADPKTLDHFQSIVDAAESKGKPRSVIGTLLTQIHEKGSVGISLVETFFSSEHNSKLNMNHAPR